MVEPKSGAFIALAISMNPLREVDERKPLALPQDIYAYR